MRRSADIGNTLEEHADGLFVGEQSVSPSNVADTPSIDLTGDGTPGNPLTAALRIAGAIVMWAADYQPDWGLLCRGQQVARADYPNLFAAIGTRWGAGNGTTTFNLPNLTGRFPLGIDLDFHPLASTGGEEFHALTAAEGPVHYHATPSGMNFLTISGSGNHFGDGGTPLISFGSADTPAVTGTAGSSAPHNNMPPYVAVGFVIVI